MEDSAKSPENDVTARNLTELLAEVDLDGEFSPEFSFKEERIEEVMQELYREIITFPPSTCTGTVDPQLNSGNISPAPASLSLLLSAPFVGNGKSSESCGAAVSDSASTVMAGVEFAGGWIVGSQENGVLVEEKGSYVMDGCDGVEFGDKWLEIVMEWAPLQLQGRT